MSEILLDWREDLPAAWRPVLNDVELGFGECDPLLELEFWEPVFPARRGKVFPGAPASAHIFRAFDRLDPSEVRCVVLGQDPYPSPDFATGRAFEAGNVAAWREFDKMFSRSMRAYMQMICAARTGKESYCEDIESWTTLLADIESGGLSLENPSEIADHWVDQGVLLLNSSLTLSRFKVEGDPHQTRGHLPVWRPLIAKVLQVLAERGQPLVVLAFGEAARQNLVHAGLSDPKPPIATFAYPHPAQADAVLELDNPFIACNRSLEREGAAAIKW